MQHEIPSDQWERCLLCGRTTKDIRHDFDIRQMYYSQAFVRHLVEVHGVVPGDYFEQTVGLERPLCTCGQCGRKVDVVRYSKALGWGKLKCGRNYGVKRWSEEAKVTRRRDGNPMFGRPAWNKGNREFAERMRVIRTGQHHTADAKRKMSESAMARTIHGHTGIRHTEASKALIRVATAKKHANGDYTHTNTRPAILVAAMFTRLGIEYAREHRHGFYTFDFYLPRHDVYVEVDGDFFHSNPLFYPDGPRSKIQWRNHYNDTRKNAYCRTNNLKLIRLWENDIVRDMAETERKLRCILNA